MIKKVKYTYRGMNQDITKSKHPFEFYYSANNIRIVATDTQSSGSVYNEKGNTQIISLPQIDVDSVNRVITYGSNTLNYSNSELTSQIGTASSGTNLIIGYGLTRDGIILFSTDNNGFDAIWDLKQIFDSSYVLELLYLRNLGFSTDNPIQSIFNFESNIIQKIYWVDGQSQMRFLNLEHSIANGDLEDLIDVFSTSTNVTGEYSLSQPNIPQISQGGVHTSGMIQYAYNLYKLNGSQTVISPLSDLVPLDFGSNSGGGEVNEIVGSSPLIEIENLDTNYTHIKLYAIKYTEYNTEPSVNLIVDEEIASYTLFSYFDDGNIIQSSSIDEFLFLGSNVFVPKHIETKDNRMFAASITDQSFDFEIDARAYSHTSGSSCAVWDNVTVNDSNIPSGSLTNIDTNTYMLALTNDAINPDYNIYKFQKDGTTLGGEGKYIKYELNQKTLAQLDNQDLRFNKFFKDNELYRIGIQFYNRLGQTSQPFWIADFKTPPGNLQGLYNTLAVEIKTTEFNAYIASLSLTEDATPVGYKIIRADREINDKTIVAQGTLTGMMCQTTKDVKNYSFWKNEINRKAESDIVAKMPIVFQRGRIFQGVSSPNDHLFHMNENGSFGDDDQEVFRESDTDFKRQQTWQFTKMIQMHSPDILFENGVTLNPTLELRLVGIAGKTQTNIWHYRVNKNNGNIFDEANIANFTNFQRGDTIVDMYGLFGPSRDGDDDSTTFMTFKQYYHDLTTFIPSTNTTTYPIYGKPEITVRGAGPTDYNNDPTFKYINNLENFLTDRKKWSGNNDKHEDAILGINSYGSQCATFVMGVSGQSIDNRKSLEELWTLANIPSTTQADRGLLMAEFAFPSYYLYVGNIYGGNSFEDKSRSSYIEIGSYQDLTSNSIQIDSPGDTFVMTYKVARLNKTDKIILSPDKMQVTEILEFPVETTVNLQNRNDSSLQAWDSNLQPEYDDYHKYNRVYSQSPNLVQNQADSFKFKKTNSFDTQIIASKLKTPGETIDSWTDFLENEIMDLDGKYGGINALVNFRDEIYALQDQGVAHITINPRVQTQAADGIDIELGRGGILYDYEYVTTTSGTINKWSVVRSPSGFYYLDAINKSWNKFQGNSIVNLSDVNGLHGFFEKNIDYTSLKIDNPLLKQGASAGFDFINNNSYLTILNNGDDFTINFNEKTQSIESFHDYFPSIYIGKGSKMITTSPNINSLYDHDEGDYQTFYDIKYPSTITLMVNPEADLDCVFNNIEFKSEVYLDDIDLSSQTITHLTAYNEYQNTGRISLVVPNNIKRKFRQWRAQIARNEGTRDRIRNPWIFLKLEFSTVQNHKLVLHDLIVNYTV